MSDLRTSELKQPVDVAEYLFRRLYQVGVRDVHGVPGDYNLVALDYIPKVGLRWVGNVNELNAGYAADGYARITGIGAVVTTFGVGELSAINAIAGAYSEYVPIVHIAGCPSTVSQKNGMLLHHTLGNGDFNVFSNMSREVSCAVSHLDDANEASLLIDNAIRECFLKSRPVYIRLPTDIVQKKIEGARLSTPLDLNYPENDKEKEEYVVNVVLRYINEAKNPMILVDACAIRHRALEEVNDFVTKSNFPVFVAPMGKGAIDETLPNFGGVYAGDGSTPGVTEQVESSDLVLSIGAIKSDFNTAGFSYRISQLSTIDFHSTFIRVKYSEYPGIRMNGVLRKITERIKKVGNPGVPRLRNQIPENEANSQSQIILHSWLWPQVGKFLREDDIVITETGTSNFGIWETTFPKGVTCISQVLWGSIGYATAACQGAALAAKGSGKRRTILFTGDGSFQLSAQELSTMIRRNLNPIIFIICNEGYTIERYIHGWGEEYNDIQPWRHGEICRTFGASPEQAKSYTIRQRSELLELFANKDFIDAQHLRLVELFMPKDDAPRSMQMTAESSARQNKE